MKFLTIAFVLCAFLVASITTVNGRRAQANELRSEEDQPSLLALLKQGLGHFVVNSISNIKEALSGSQNWRGIIYLNDPNHLDGDDDDDVGGYGYGYDEEKSEILTLLYILVKKMDMLLDATLGLSYTDEEQEGDDEEYYDYGSLFGSGNESNGKDEDEYDEEEYDWLNYFDGNDDDAGEYDSYYEDGYADRDGEEDDGTFWSSIFSTFDGDDNDDDYNEEDYDEYYKEETETEKEHQLAEEKDADNKIKVEKTKSNTTEDNKKLIKPAEMEAEAAIKKELDNMIKDIKPDVVKEASKRN